MSTEGTRTSASPAQSRRRRRRRDCRRIPTPWRASGRRPSPRASRSRRSPSPPCGANRDTSRRCLRPSRRCRRSSGCTRRRRPTVRTGNTPAAPCRTTALGSAKMRPAPLRPGNSCTWSVIRAPAESTSQNTGSSSESARSVSRMIFSTVRAPHDPAFTVGSFAMHAHRPPVDRADARHDAIGREVVGRCERVRQQRILHERSLVEQQRQPIANEELALCRQLLGLHGEVALESTSGAALKIVHQRQSTTTVTTGAEPGASPASCRGRGPHADAPRGTAGRWEAAPGSRTG